MSGLEKEGSLHNNTTFFCQGLQSEMKTIKEQAAKGEAHRRALLENQDEMKKENIQLKKNNAEMNDKLVSLFDQNAEMIRSFSKLEREFTEYKALGPPLTEALKQQVYQEYRKYPELVKEVM